MKNQKLRFAANKKEKSATVWIYGDIGDGWFEGITAKEVGKELEKAGDIDTINGYINSPGGDVYEGVAMYNIFRRHKAKKIFEIDAQAGSIASVIAMAADELRIADNGVIMIHDPWTIALGNSNDFREIATRLDMVRDNSILPAYMKRTNLSENEVLDLMAKETEMNAEQALDWGFVDEIIGEKRMAAYFDIGKYKSSNRAKLIKRMTVDDISKFKSRNASARTQSKSEKPIVSRWKLRLARREMTTRARRRRG